MFTKISLPGRSKCTTNSVLRKNVAYFIKLFRSAVRLMENKLVYSILAFAIKGIVSGKETVHTMRSSDNIVKSWERVQTDKPYRILGSL